MPEPHTDIEVISQDLYNKVKQFESVIDINNRSDSYTNKYDSGDAVYSSNLGFNMIRIVPNWSKWTWGDSALPDKIKKALNTPVYGLMTNEFTYSLSSEWESITPPSLLDLDLFSNLTALANGGELGAKFKSTKFWKKSGDLTITPEIRIFDIRGDGTPLKVVNQLLLFATAVGEMEVIGGLDNDFVDAGRETVKGGVVAVKNTIATATESALTGKTVDKALDISSKIVGVAGQALYNRMEELADYNRLRACPPPLDVQIGKIFRHPDMVLTNIEFSFSREQSSMGPLYVDCKLTFVTRSIISNINETGIYDTVAKLDDITSTTWGTKFEIKFQDNRKNEQLGSHIGGQTPAGSNIVVSNPGETTSVVSKVDVNDTSSQLDLLMRSMRNMKK